MKTKKEKYFLKIKEYKDRFKHMSVSQLEKKLTMGPLIKEAAIAVRELLEEKITNE